MTPKLYTPKIPIIQVVRNAIWDIVRSSPQARLILVRAPAGFGKTTTMVQLQNRIKEDRIATSWLTLDDTDNEPARFLAGLSAAAARITHGTGARSIPTPPKNSRPLVGELSVGELAFLTSPFALFLDDFHRIKEPAILRLLETIIERLPPFGRIIIGTRVLPKLDLGRLRKSGLLLELDANLLRFSLDETTEFFKYYCSQQLTEEDVSKLQHNTAGWVGALSIATLALNRREASAEFIERFSGTYPDITNYFLQEVFAKQTQNIQEFLLSTSVLRQFTAPLCNTLTERQDGAEMFRLLDAEGLFLVPVESNNELTYRYHHLFGGFLRGLLTRKRPDEKVMRLHRTASMWYETQNQIEPAIDHALEAKDYENALRLLAWNTEKLLEQGHMNLLHRWFLTIPEEMLAHDPLLQVTYAWAVCFVNGPMEATTLLNRLGCENRADPLVHVHLLAFRLWLKVNSDHIHEKQEIIEMGRKALKLVPTGSLFVQDLLVKMVTNSLAVLGRREEAQQLLDKVQNSKCGTTSFGKMLFESGEGHFDLLEGHLRMATARFQMALSAYTFNHSRTLGNPYPGVLYASVVYEADECALAEYLLQVYLPSAEKVRAVDCVIIAYTTLSRIAGNRSDEGKALQLLDGLEQFGRRNELLRPGATAKLERSRLLLMQGRLSEAKEVLDRTGDPEMWQMVRTARLLANDTEYFELYQLRWQIMAGNAERALPGLEKEISEAVASLRHRRALKLQLLRVLALDRSGDRSGALVHLSKLLRHTYVEGFYRLLVDEGPAVGTLVHHFEKVYQQQGINHDPIFAIYLQRLLRAFSAVPLQIENMDAASGAQAAENLTPKEIRILQLVAEGYPNKAIAQQLFVSDSTVRTHLRNISAKLGANNRTEAVAIGRRFRVITN